MGGFDEFVLSKSLLIVNAGVHSNTNTYIDPSNNDCTKPSNKTFLSI